jgi:hypothetical protein
VRREARTSGVRTLVPLALVALCAACGGTGTGGDREAVRHKDPPLRAAAAPVACKTFARHGGATYDLCQRRTSDNHGIFVVHEGGVARRLAVRTPHAPPPGTPLVGHWQSAALSPDGKTLLATWSAECEVPIAFFVPLATGLPRPVEGQRRWADAPESVGVRWLSSTRAVVDFPKGACGNSARPGRYAVTLSGRLTRLR